MVLGVAELVEVGPARELEHGRRPAPGQGEGEGEGEGEGWGWGSG